MRKVLIIEDNEDNMALITQLLESTGAYEIVSANTGISGVTLSLNCKPDVILLDIQLPDIDGTEVLKRIRSSDAGKHISIIAVTSYAMSGDKERLIASGCNGYLEKPIDPMNFVTQIEKVIGK